MRITLVFAALVCMQMIVLAQDALIRTPVLVQDFEQASSLPKVAVVNIPDQNASLELSTDNPSQGKQCLKLHYHFTGDGQYLVIPIPLKIDAPIHKVHFMLNGDGSGSGYGLYLTDASGETHKYRDAANMAIDFKGWKEIVVDLDSPHETWGGDKNGKIDYPLKGLTIEISTPGKEIESDLFFDSITVDSEENATATMGSFISVTSPNYGDDVKGKTSISVAAPGFKKVTASCWKQGKGFGTDTTIADVALDAQGSGSFEFPADDFPHGPLVVTISGEKGKINDNCYLQLYNTGGVSWNEGIPKDPPQAAKGLQLVFADDFNVMPSISNTDLTATYYDHKPPNGSQDFSSIPFTSHSAPNDPFLQRDTYLRIRASEKTHSAGLISSLKNDGSGVKVSAPCYFECRFLAQSAIGSWPAFWLLSDNVSKPIDGCDELDIIEAVGGEGPGAPNAASLYQITPHAWAQGDKGKELETAAYKAMKNPCNMTKFGIPSSWHNTFHTYGCLVTDTDTIYYCDNIEVGRHKTLPLSKKQPMFFLINMATGGGWPVDLSRYNGQADMYVDFVRVYAASK
jgi:Glycosyl hydrolases family 16